LPSEAYERRGIALAGQGGQNLIEQLAEVNRRYIEWKKVSGSRLTTGTFGSPVAIALRSMASTDSFSEVFTIGVEKETGSDMCLSDYCLR
jgi:hypothetical protein